MTAQDAFAELTQRLQARQPLLWLNPALAPAKRALADIAATHAIGLADICSALAPLRAHPAPVASALALTFLALFAGVIRWQAILHALDLYAALG